MFSHMHFQNLETYTNLLNVSHFFFRRNNHLDQWFPTLVLGTPCLACFRCFPAPIHLLQMNDRYQASAELDHDPFIWIRCVGAVKHLKHAGQWVPEDQDLIPWSRLSVFKLGHANFLRGVCDKKIRNGAQCIVFIIIWRFPICLISFFL